MTMTNLSQEKIKHNDIVFQEIGDIINRACSLHAYAEWDDDKRRALQMTVARTLDEYVKTNSKPVIHDEDGWTYALEGFEINYHIDEKRISVDAEWLPIKKWID